MNRMILLDNERVRALWPQLRPGIEAALEYCPDGQLPEDVFMSLMNGQSGCYATFDDADDGMVTGLLVARKLQVAGRSLFLVWLCWNRNEATIADFWPQVIEIASELDCSRIVIESTRPYHRALPGLRLVSSTYHYEVGNGWQQDDH